MSDITEDIPYHVNKAIAEERLEQSVYLLRRVLSMRHPAICRVRLLDLIHQVERFQDGLWREGAGIAATKDGG